MTTTEKLAAAQRRNDSLLCVGLDPDPSRFPESFANDGSEIRRFNQAIIEATADLACCYKPNLGFYLPWGNDGIDALAALRDDVPQDIPLLLDAKVGDLDVTTTAYARAYFDLWGFDAVTAHPYLGHDSLAPLLAYEDRLVFVLAKTSNPGAGLLQDRTVSLGATGGENTIAVHVARTAAEQWNEHGNVGLVAGATYPEDLAMIRLAAPDLPILIPGVGAQEGDLGRAVEAGLRDDGAGILVSASRAISYASSGDDFQDAARRVATELRDSINHTRQAVTFGSD